MQFYKNLSTGLKDNVWKAGPIDEEKANGKFLIGASRMRIVTKESTVTENFYVTKEILQLWVLLEFRSKIPHCIPHPLAPQFLTYPHSFSFSYGIPSVEFQQFFDMLI